MELTYLLFSLAPTMIMGEDFNCVLTNTNCNWTIKFSKVLDQVARGFGLVDVGETVPPRAECTNYTSHGATRLDRICVTSNRSGQKLRVENMAVAVTSPSGVYASSFESPSPTARPGPVENEYETFRRYNYQKLFSA